MRRAGHGRAGHLAGEFASALLGQISSIDAIMALLSLVMARGRAGPLLSCLCLSLKSMLPALPKLFTDQVRTGNSSDFVLPPSMVDACN